MASSSQRVVHQDYIARIRYSNALPPPPNPPKLLDIPNTGLSSGQYTTPGFASRLARDQPLNIEADAELGMPLDLVGMPGIFDGDESSIQAPLNAPIPHPHDRPLLRPLSTLGKPKFSDSGVSFLRRTEYISSYTSKSQFNSVTSRSLINSTGKDRPKKAAYSVDKESPEFIKTQVEKSFEIAAKNLETRAVMHPSNRNVKLVECYPLIPDLHSFPDPGGYATIKFTTNPVPPSTAYDTRLECSMLVPMEPSAEEQAQRQQMQEAHEMDPARNPAPDTTIEYEFLMLQNPKAVQNLKRRFDPLDEERDDDSLYTDVDQDGNRAFRFKRVRAYESQTSSGAQERKYDDEVVIAVHDGSDGLRSKGAYYYPVIKKLTIRPQRQKNINLKRNRFVPADEDASEGPADFIDLQIMEPDAKTRKDREIFAAHPFGLPEEEDDEEEKGERDGEGEVDADGELDGDASPERRDD